MVSFTPSIPESQDPSYLGMSRPISAFALHPNPGPAAAISGFGDMLTDVAKGADNTIKSVIDSALTSGVDQQREGFTGALEQVGGIPQANRVADYQPDNTVSNPSGLTGSINVPDGVQNGVNTASNLVSAASTGKFTPTYYTGRLDMLAKDLRSQFAGHRDYIDQKIAQETGGNPANEYIRQLLTQINQGVANNRTDMEKDLSFIRDHSGIQGAAGIYQARQQGLINGAQVVQWASKNTSITEAANQAKADFEIHNYSYQDGALKATQVMNTLGDDRLNHGFVTLGTVLGGKAGGLNFNDIGPTLNKLASGDIKMSEDDATKLAYSFQVFRDNTYNQMRTDAINAGVTKYMKPEEIDAAINGKLKYVDSIVSHLINKEYGPAYQDFNAVRSITDGTSKDLMNSTDTTVQKYFRVAGAANKIGGPNAAIGLIKDAVSDGLPGALRQVVDNAKLDIATQTDPNHQPVTLSGYIDKLQKAGVGVDTDPNKPSPAKKTERAAYDSITNIVQKAADPNIPAELRANIYNGSYGPGNQQLISKFAKDSFDKNGNFIPGQNAIFGKMTAPNITDEAWNLKNQGHPEAWQNYKTWAEGTYGQLFGQSIRDLNTLAINPNIKFTYNSDTHHIGVDFADTFYTSPYTKGGDTSVQTALANSYKQQVAFINSGLDSMANIAKKEGRDVNAYLLNNLQAENLDPQSIGAKIQKAVQSSGQPVQKSEGDGSSPYRPDKLVGSLIPQSVKDYVAKASTEPFQFPTLQDFTGPSPKPANVDENGIKGTANAAHVSPQWGNPFSPAFKDEHLTDIKAPNGEAVHVNKYAAPAFDGFLKDLAASGYNVKDVQGYSLREKRGVGGISQHAFGNAIDINPDENPTGSNGKLPANVSEMAAKWGLTWGGDWSKRYKDPMHFEFTGKMPNISEPGYKAASR